MKLIMTLFVRDEEDIVGENIEYHLSRGVDHVIATDNLSRDATGSILREFERSGRLTYRFDDRDTLPQADCVTLMARVAHAMGADWVINNDADEFWWPENGWSLKAELEAIPAAFDGIFVERSNYLRRRDTSEESPFYETMIHRDLQSRNPIGKPLPGKSAHRAHAEVNVQPGNHHFALAERKPNVALCRRIQVFHYPIRSYAEFENSILLGGAAYRRNAELPETTGIARRTLYAIALQGSLPAYYQQNLHDDDSLTRRMKAGEVREDARLRDALRKLRAGQQESANPQTLI